ncbi:DUF4253 domain-containing protein [Streptomyces sp. NPDC056527]|uniref:DUF4253 domain-containing protein n=1 Tax=Streptomyces sp. NPDC056527 TaxID=3345853 RepID=UPI0036C5DA5F
MSIAIERRPAAPSWEHGPGAGRRSTPTTWPWHDRFRAELLHVSRRTLILDVALPSQEPQAVAETAIGQYAYCPDGIDTASWADHWTRFGTWHFSWD